jgi:hypothetical protein
LLSFVCFFFVFFLAAISAVYHRHIPLPSLFRACVSNLVRTRTSAIWSSSLLKARTVRTCK